MSVCGVSPSIVPVPRPLHNITCSKPTRIFFVSAKFQQRRSRRQNTNYNYNHYEDGDDDGDDESMTISTETQESYSNSYFKSEETGEQHRVPSGSDILRALQRATVRKHNKKKKQQLLPVPDSKGKLDVVSLSNTHVNVKPLRIRPDWSTRLDELERRLQDLLHV